jgi:predicted TIM-barrel fold metal-dependent hydrolase
MDSNILVTTPMRAASTNTPPAFTIPPRSCDSHFHVFEPGYPHVPNPLYTFPDGTVDQYLALLDFLGIDRCVLVQPTFYGTDNTLALDTLKRIGSRCRAVVRVEEDISEAELDRLLKVLRQGNCWVKLSGPYRIAKEKGLDSVAPIGRALVETRPDRLIWGSDWPHLPNGQRDTGEVLNLLGDWAPDAATREQILVAAPDRLFFYE